MLHFASIIQLVCWCVSNFQFTLLRYVKIDAKLPLSTVYLLIFIIYRTRVRVTAKVARNHIIKFMIVLLLLSMHDRDVWCIESHDPGKVVIRTTLCRDPQTLMGPITIPAD